MAIRVRRGNEADFDVNKMLPGEWAVSLDTRYVRMCFAPGVCLRMATYEGFESDMERVESILTEVESIEEAIKVIQRDINANVDIAIEQKELASEYAEQSKEYARQAKESAERAAEVSDISYGSSDRAGIVAPQDIYVDPSNGHMELIATASASPLQNSFNGGLRFTEMIGKSEQNTTTGKNLLPAKEYYTSTNNGITYTCDKGEIKMNGTATASSSFSIVGNFGNDYTTPRLALTETYIVSGTDGIQLQARCTDGSYITLNGTNGIGKEIGAVYFQIASGTTVNKTIKPMINYGTEALPYEPYSGGKPAPNPDYPQEIKSVSISEIKTHRKNLLDITTLKPRNSTQGGSVSFVGDVANISSINQSWAVCKSDVMAVEKGKKYVLRFDISDYSATTRTYVTSSNANDVEYGSKDFNGTNGYCEYVFTPTEDTLIISIFSNGSSNKVTNTFTLSNMQLELGEKATEYVPFAESVATLSNFKLNAIGNVKDRLFKKDGLWQVERKIKSYTFTGNETGWNISATYVGSVWIDFVNKIGLPKAIYGAGSWCSHFQTVPLFSNYTRYGQAVVEVAGFNMWMKDGTVSGESEVKEFLKNNNVTLLYVTETPTIEILPLADQVALNSLLTFDGTTYLDIESVLEPQFALEYGTSKLGGYTLQSLNTAEANQARIIAMETLTNNLADAILQGEE